MRLPIPALPLAAAVAALVLTGCSSGSPDPVAPTASGSSPASSAPSATSPAPSTSAPSPTSTASSTPSSTPLSTPEAQASALVGGLASAGGLSEEQRQQAQDQIATALADADTQRKLQQVCGLLRTGLVSDASLRSAVRQQLTGTGTHLSDAQVDALLDTLRTDVCTS